ncbi:MAG: HK97 family phage prohead protease [Planctomycetia bacterium]|nr:HK97 family phage prohead protease [Planctomycetia bacterium]
MDQIISGLAAPFHRAGDSTTQYVMPDSRIERFAPSAFATTLAGSRPIQACLHHNRRVVLASTGDNTLRLRTDTRGLWFALTVPDWLGRGLADEITGSLSGASICFGALTEREFTEHGQRVREITQARLTEVSILTRPLQPAYAATGLNIRLSRIGRGDMALRLALVSHTF